MKGYWFRTISLLFLLFVSAGLAKAQPAVSSTVTGHITAEVISTLSAIEATQLSFGKFSPGTHGGKLIISPENAISVTGSVWPGSGIHSAASFYVTGEPGVTYTVTLPSSPVTITHVNSARTMTVEDWTSVPLPEPGAGILEDGYQVVYVGATLSVGTLNDNPVGVYTGTYSITFDFN
jgi:hypothetical protein